jgi:hypothetical protein
MMILPEELIEDQYLQMCVLEIMLGWDKEFLGLDYYSQIPWTRELVNNRNLFPTVLEARKSKVKGPADSVSAEHLLFHRWHLPSVFSHVRKTTNLIDDSSAFMNLTISQMVLPPKTISLVVKSSTYDLGGRPYYRLLLTLSEKLVRETYKPMSTLLWIILKTSLGPASLACFHHPEHSKDIPLLRKDHSFYSPDKVISIV